MKVLEVAAGDSDTIIEVLGITEKRAREIVGFVEEARDANEKLSQMILQVQEKLVHANELCFACLVIGKIETIAAIGGHGMFMMLTGRA